MDFLGEVVREFTPSEKETKALKAVIRHVITALQKELDRRDIKAEVMLGGSAAKGTFLKHDFDCDCFVRFHKQYMKDDISDILESALKIFAGIERVPGSRDYFQFEHEGIEFEVVPVLKVSSHKGVQNITDASPLHVGWITKHIKKNPKLRNEILLTKLFLKAHDLYGAESHIRGFSGHIVDLLTIHYGSFLAFLEGASQWEPTKVIDVEGHHKDAIKAINRAKHGPLILVDPIQPERNAAAALSKENFLRLRDIARKFLKNPTKKMFRRKELTKSDLLRQSHGRKLLMLTALPKEGKYDVMGAKMLKVYHYLMHQLQAQGFHIDDSGWRFTPKRGGEAKTFFWFILPKELILATYEHMGPPVKDTLHAKKFREKHKHAVVRNNRLYTKVKRRHRKPEKLIRELITEKTQYIFSRATHITLTVRTP